MRYNLNRYLSGITLMSLTFAAGTAYGFSPERYASSSRMAAGKWAKVRVNETGMQLITNAQLKNMGFSDPSKVHVYGYGGRMISETLDESHHDDLPLQPSVKTAKGIVFYGTDRTSWSADRSKNSLYGRTQNPYSLYSYYLISDCPIDEVEMPVVSQGVATSSPATTFTAHLLHEQELQSPFVSGRAVFGEDFRTQTFQSFPFALPGHVGSDIAVSTVFGIGSSSEATSYSVTADGNSDPSNPSASQGRLNSNVYNQVVSRNQFSGIGDKVSIGIKFNPSGAVTLARLDYIIVEYERALDMGGSSDLHFYDISEVGKSYTVSGCSASTEIWDVTDAGNPKKIEARREGEKLTFVSPEFGYREFIAFDAERVSRSITPSGSVSTQNIHSLPVPDMLIIAPQQYVEQSRRIAAIHEDIDNWRVHILTPEALYNEFSSGTPDVSAFRKALKMWYDRGEEDGHKLSHCLIISRPTYDNLGVSSAVKGLSYPRVPMWMDYYEANTGTYHKDYSYGMDDFICMLEDGASTTQRFSTTKVSIAAGRMPVKSVAELTTMVDKLEKYVREPSYGSWRGRGVILADDEDAGTHMDQANDFYKEIVSGNPALNYDRIYIDTYTMEASGRGFSYPAAKSQLLHQLNEGVATWTYVGHGHPSGLTKEDMFNWTDINSLSNKHPFVMYAPTCEFLRWDDDDISGAEILWLYPEGGSIAMMIATRSVTIHGNGALTRAMGNHWTVKEKDGRGLTIGEILRRSKNDLRIAGSSTYSNNELRFAIMGDPALRLPTPIYNVVVDEINGKPVNDPSAMPEFGANDRMEVKGHIEDATGAVVPDFNGEIELVLYDAERVVQANGNHGDDKAGEKAFNMRTSQLNKMREHVTAGEWTSTMIVPSIIDNNYSPARLATYAYDSKGLEALGGFENFYIYGEGSQSFNDDNPPEIELLALNSENFNPGDIVNESPIVLARVRDDNGLNIYGGVIGQQITLSVDGQTYTGVSEYYTPALSDPGAGSLFFPLSSLEPGDHELSLTVFDMAGNYTTASVPFRVAIGRAPSITDVTTNVNPATTSVKITLTHDRPSEVLDCLFEVFDLSGRKVWSKNISSASGTDATAQVTWNLCDSNGARVPRGIYLYRATITTSEGATTSKTKKLAVTAR